MNILKKTILGALATPAKISKAESVSEHFRMIELEAEEFKKVQWQPGCKIGIILNGDKRIYTPISIDTASGHLKFLVYLHGKGMGSAWAAAAKESAICQYIGPRSSLDFSNITGSAVLFGDETSFGVANVLKTHLSQGVKVGLIFEVSSISEAQAALKSVELEDALVFEKKHDGSHLNQVAAEIRKSISELKPSNLVLTGCGSSIQTLRAALKSEEVLLAKNKTKAYWSPGKLGLD